MSNNSIKELLRTLSGSVCCKIPSNMGLYYIDDVWLSNGTVSIAQEKVVHTATNLVVPTNDIRVVHGLVYLKFLSVMATVTWINIIHLAYAEHLFPEEFYSKGYDARDGHLYIIVAGQVMMKIEGTTLL